MKFKTSLQEFQHTLQKTLPALPRKSTLPVLEHLLFTLTDSSLQIVATDQDITIKTTMKVESFDEGSVLIPGRRLSEIINALDRTGEIEFNSDEDNFEISLLTPSGKYIMKGLSSDEYLTLPELFESEKPSLDFAEGVEPSDLAAVFTREDINRIANKTTFAVSTDEFRPAMNGVLFQFRENRLNAVSTDSFRLVRNILRKDKTVFPKELDIIIPARAMEILKKVDANLVMSVVKNRGKITHIRFDINEMVFVTRIIDEKFPPYETVIPEACEYKVIFNQKEILNAIRRVSIFTSDISHQVSLKFEQNNVYLKGEDEETGAHGDESISCEYIGESFEVTFNYRYLEQAIDNLENESEDNTIILNYKEPGRPVLLKPNNESDEILMLIMPVRTH